MKNKRYIIFNKPYGVISQFTTEEGHLTLANFNLPKDVYPVGRLDKDSEGLLLLSDDGPFIKQFLDNHPRVYWAQVEKIPTAEDIERLSSGVKIKTGKTAPCEVCLLDDPGFPARVPPIRERKAIPTAWIELVLFEGKNRQVRKMTAHVGHPTLRLIRVGLGLVLLKDLKLKSGEWVEVRKDELIG